MPPYNTNIDPRADNYDQYASHLRNRQALLGDLGRRQSAFSGVRGAGDVRRMYGLSDPDFGAQKKQLGIQRDRAVQSALTQAGRSATPGMSASGVESSYAGSLQGLLGQEASEKSGMDRYVAQLLQGALGAQDEFGLRKSGMEANLIGQDVNDQMQRMQFDREGESPDFLSYLGAVMPGLGSILGGPIGGAAIKGLSSLFGGSKNQPGGYTGGNSRYGGRLGRYN